MLARGLTMLTVAGSIALASAVAPSGASDAEPLGGDAAPDAKASEAGPPPPDAPEPPVPACIAVKSAAVYSGSGYDHVVTFQSACARDARCVVHTDVNPEPIRVVVPAGQTREVVTFRGSPASKFVATARCKLTG